MYSRLLSALIRRSFFVVDSVFNVPPIVCGLLCFFFFFFFLHYVVFFLVLQSF